ncbi:MAG: hypothetical protein EXR28_07635 [Betaproteobacteria bacterium]|nr:hypothetical protein [Betaproteobacteria bacterium]
MPTARKFAVCIKNIRFEASLIVGKLYGLIPDSKASTDDLVRIIDEDEEDYLYPAKYFVPLEIPAAAARRLRNLEKTS